MGICRKGKGIGLFDVRNILSQCGGLNLKFQGAWGLFFTESFVLEKWDFVCKPSGLVGKHFKL